MHPNRFAIAKLSTEATKDGSHIEHSGQSPVFFQPETVSSFPSTFVGDLSFEEPQKERSKSLKKPVRKVTTTKLFSRKASTVSTGSVSLADLAAVTVITNSGNELSDIIHNSSIALGNAVASSESSLSSCKQYRTIFKCTYIIILVNYSYIRCFKTIATHGYRTGDIPYCMSTEVPTK